MIKYSNECFVSKKHIFDIQFELGKRLTLRRTPRIKFILDSKQEDIKKVERLLENISKHEG